MISSNENPKILVLIATLDKYPDNTIRSLLKQTLPPTKIVVVSRTPVDDKSGEVERSKISLVVDKADKRLCLGKRVAQALNSAIETVILDDYDFILKADMDIEFPEKFIEVNVNSGFDLLGKGAGMLINVSHFRELMNGKFFEACADDEYVQRVFLVNYCEVLPWDWVLPARIRREKSQNCWRRYRIGRDNYRCGDPLFWSIVTIIADALKNKHLVFLFDLLGHIRARYQDLKHYPISQKWSVFVLQKWIKSGGVKRVVATIDKIVLKRKPLIRTN